MLSADTDISSQDAVTAPVNCVPRIKSQYFANYFKSSPPVGQNLTYGLRVFGEGVPVVLHFVQLVALFLLLLRQSERRVIKSFGQTLEMLF